MTEVDAGWSDESMRFAGRREAQDWINEKTMPWNYGIRYEEDWMDKQTKSNEDMARETFDVPDSVEGRAFIKAMATIADFGELSQDDFFTEVGKIISHETISGNASKLIDSQLNEVDALLMIAVDPKGFLATMFVQGFIAGALFQKHKNGF